MTQNDIRRKRLRQEEPFFRQQASYLRRMGHDRALMTDDDSKADALRDLDLLAWDESDQYFSRFAEDMMDAPYAVIDLLMETGKMGRKIGMEVELPSLVAALTLMRIFAGGWDVCEKYQKIRLAIMKSQADDPRAEPLFIKYRCEMGRNRRDLATGEKTIYPQGDPMERLKNPEVEKAKARTEELLGLVLDATKGWNSKNAFANCWELWRELWHYLLGHEEWADKISTKRPRGMGNSTSINIRLVCNVAGLLRLHLGAAAPLNGTEFAKLIKDAWNADSCRKEFCKTTELSAENVKLATGWLDSNQRLFFC